MDLGGEKTAADYGGRTNSVPPQIGREVRSWSERAEAESIDTSLNCLKKNLRERGGLSGRDGESHNWCSPRKEMGGGECNALPTPMVRIFGGE